MLWSGEQALDAVAAQQRHDEALLVHHLLNDDVLVIVLSGLCLGVEELPFLVVNEEHYKHPVTPVELKEVGELPFHGTL